jgi:hypothetical protein
MHGHLEMVVRMVVSEGENFDDADGYGILNAATHGHLDVVLYLCEIRAPRNFLHISRLCARIAAYNGYLSILRLFYPFHSGTTRGPVYAAVKGRKINTVKYLYSVCKRVSVDLIEYIFGNNYPEKSPTFKYVLTAHSLTKTFDPNMEIIQVP